METDNYKTGLVLSQRCVGLEDKDDVVTGAGGHGGGHD